MPSAEFSQRAKEVAEDVLAALRDELAGEEERPLRFHLDNSDITLDQVAVVRWIKESVDAGYPEIRLYVEARTAQAIIVNCAAFEDPDSQYHP